VNLPLNIDLQQILLHLLNFAVLSFGLYLLLYNPIKKFIKKREDYYRDLDNKAEEKLKKAEELESAYKKRLENVESEIKEIRAKAAEETKQATDALLENAREQAAKIVSQAREAAQKEREKILENAQKEIASMAVAAAEKLLSQSATDTLDQFLLSVKKE